MTIQDSYSYCRQVARRSSSSFYWSFRLLDRERRDAMCALYAFSRQTDDLADEAGGSEQERAAAIAQWRASLRSALGGEPDGPLWVALADAARRWEIPHQHLFDLVDGVESDMQPRRFESFDELLEYCDLVASSVGLACLRIWGCRHPDATQPAMACGRAFQLTNILRDVREDAERGRIYLPLDDLRQFDVDEQDLLHARAHPQWNNLLDAEIEKTQQLYRTGAGTSDYLEGGGLRMFRLMFDTYHSLLDVISRERKTVLRRRVSLSFRRKLRLALRHLGRPRHVND